MQFDKNSLLNALNTFSKVSHSDLDGTIRKSAVLESIKAQKPETVNPAKDVLDAVRLARKGMVESSWTPRKTSVKELVQRVIVESTEVSPNAFRLNLDSIVMDRTHAKFSMTRQGKNVIIELMYPNVNNKITVRISIPGDAEELYEIGTEDGEYINDFGAYIIKQADVLINELANKADTNGTGETMYLGNKSGGMTGFPPIWESDSTKLSKLLTLVEQETDKDADPAIDDNATDETGDAGIDVGGDNAGFTEDDFSVDSGAETDVGGFPSDFGGGGGFDAGGGGGAPSSGAEVNAGGMADDEEYLTFRDKLKGSSEGSWTQSALDGMQKLTSADISDEMTKGKGVILTADQVRKGFVGLINDKPIEIVDKFLKIYKDLDSIDLTSDQLEEIDDKLSSNVDDFDAWLQEKLPEFRGQSEVDETLDNELFQEFPPMGGPEEQGEPQANGSDLEFDQWLDNLGDFGAEGEEGEEGGVPNVDEEAAQAEVEEDLGAGENEFPNL